MQCYCRLQYAEMLTGRWLCTTCCSQHECCSQDVLVCISRLSGNGERPFEYPLGLVTNTKVGRMSLVFAYMKRATWHWYAASIASTGMCAKHQRAGKRNCMVYFDISMRSEKIAQRRDPTDILEAAGACKAARPFFTNERRHQISSTIKYIETAFMNSRK